MKKRFVSGLQPSGNLHIGNYLGAVKQFIELQDEYEPLVFIADLHAITVPQDPVELRAKTIEITKIYLAAGLDPEKCTLFVQSQVPEHAELGWILNTIARMGDLDKMTQFKDKAQLKQNLLNDVFTRTKKSQEILGTVTKDLESLSKINNVESKSIISTYSEAYKSAMKAFNEIIVSLSDVIEDIGNKERSSVGLYDYPVLQAADILLYDAALVPVGEDQLQHIELTRTLARRFNDRFGSTFVLPEAKIVKDGARIMGLDDPSKKMSKSAESVYNYISLIDDAETVERKVKKSVTDSGTEIAYQDDKPALKNLINIYSLFASEAPENIVGRYKGKGYGDFKTDLAKVINDFLVPFQERFNKISDEEVLQVLENGRKKASVEAQKKMKLVREKIGLL